MYDELPIYEVEEISLEEAVTIIASDDTLELDVEHISEWQ